MRPLLISILLVASAGGGESIMKYVKIIGGTVLALGPVTFLLYLAYGGIKVFAIVALGLFIAAMAAVGTYLVASGLDNK